MISLKYYEIFTFKSNCCEEPLLQDQITDANIGRRRIRIILTCTVRKAVVIICLQRLLLKTRIAFRSIDFVAALRKGRSNEGILPTTKVVIERAGNFVKSLGIQHTSCMAKNLSAACNVLINCV